MFYAWEIAEFRQHLRLVSHDGEFKRLRYRCERVSVKPGNGRSRCVETESTVRLSAPARIFGRPIRAECLDGVGESLLVLPAKAVQEIPGGTIIGLSAALDKDGGLYSPGVISDMPSLQDALKRNLSNAEGYVLDTFDGEAKACFFVGKDRKHHPLSALFLTNMEIANYGSFLVRVLPQLIHSKDVIMQCDCYVVSDRSPWVTEALRILGLPQLPIFTVKEVCGDSFDNVFIFDFCDTEGFLSSPIVNGIRKVTESVRRMNNFPSPAKSIYVSRTLSRTGIPFYRPLQHEVVIEELMKKRGYQVFFPETVSLEQQIRTFVNANRIIGPSGSGMLNAIFADSDTKVVDCESYTVAVRQHAKMYSSTGKTYGFCFGELASEGGELSLMPWKIEAGLLEQALEWLG